MAYVWSRRTKWLRKLVISGVCFIVLIAACAFYFLGLWDWPRQPESWSLIKEGMSRSEVVAALGEPTRDMRDLKGYELWHFKTPSDPWYYQLLVAYANDDTVKDAYSTLIFDKLGPLNDTWIVPVKF